MINRSCRAFEGLVAAMLAEYADRCWTDHNTGIMPRHQATAIPPVSASMPIHLSAYRTSDHRCAISQGPDCTGTTYSQND
jgi:hypothetical protein